MENQLIPERLKMAREKLGITMAEASRRLNLSKIGYCRYEYGERVPSYQTVEVIARCLCTSVDYLVGKTDDMSPDYLVISKKDAPYLFELVQNAYSFDSDTLKRLITYSTRICESQLTSKTDK
ncbi:MAG: helix-turn-helix transcriptional regulator [Lachnospiraceae bacterium]|jgi:transcriptional regulator with XRE-family HTH domain|uniref:helix-turn-helix domain-containing protein n=1 Tax=unclassified Butyrivibrio TaxID=2639466 RepID=UPI00047D197A|nr:MULTISPECIES: helix-turn-helix transcriptional regulator [unclassified Butyrivibrio]MBQ9279360.1 helix-turn-helix transcriptional regulator [Lachnospiraceae bacterium]SFC10280.1 Helix-turn-helix domain-containing protein [Butyrivibrio sp. YAB3001]